MAYDRCNKCTEQLCKRTVLVQLIVEDVVTILEQSVRTPSRKMLQFAPILHWTCIWSVTCIAQKTEWKNFQTPTGGGLPVCPLDPPPFDMTFELAENWLLAVLLWSWYNRMIGGPLDCQKKWKTKKTEVAVKQKNVVNDTPEKHIDGWQHKGAMSTFWRNWDFDISGQVEILVPYRNEEK